MKISPRLALTVSIVALAGVVVYAINNEPPSPYHAPQSARTPEGAQRQPPRITVTLPGGRTIDTNGLRLIEGFEGYSRCAYWDPYGRVWTAGYGQTVGVSSGFCFANQRAAQENLRRSVVREYEWAVHEVSHTFGQHAVNALDSFAYNLGAGIFTGTLRVVLARHAYYAAGNIMLQYDHAGGQVLPGLRTRRELEVRVLRAPDPVPAPSRRDLERGILEVRVTLRRHHCRTVHGRHAWHGCPGAAVRGRRLHRELDQLHRGRR